MDSKKKFCSTQFYAFQLKLDTVILLGVFIGKTVCKGNANEAENASRLRILSKQRPTYLLRQKLKFSSPKRLYLTSTSLFFYFFSVGK